MGEVKKVILFIFFLISLISNASALSCLPNALLQDLTKETNIILAKVIEQKGNDRLLIRIEKVLNGGLENNNKLELDVKSLLYWSFGKINFRKDSLFVMKPYLSSEGKYVLSPCAPVYKVDHGSIDGVFYLDQGEQNYSLERLESEIKKNINNKEK